MVVTMFKSVMNAPSSLISSKREKTTCRSCSTILRTSRRGRYSSSLTMGLSSHLIALASSLRFSSASLEMNRLKPSFLPKKVMLAVKNVGSQFKLCAKQRVSEQARVRRDHRIEQVAFLYLLVDKGLCLLFVRVVAVLIRVGHRFLLKSSTRQVLSIVIENPSSRAAFNTAKSR